MTTFLLIAGLGAAIGLAFHVIVLIVVSAVVLVFMFVTSTMADLGLTTAVVDAVIGVLVLQLGYLAGAFTRSLAAGASSRGNLPAATAFDQADVDRPLSSLDAGLSLRPLPPTRHRV